MSSRFSPDGMYYWDGVQWLSTLSPDGRYRWDGTAWQPVAWASPPGLGMQPPVQRAPTSWTAPLQYAVTAWYVISAAVSLSLPFSLSGVMAQIMQSAFAREQQRNPNLAPPPPGFLDSMTSMLNGILWVAAIFGFAICVVVIIGALRRWTWIYYAVLVLLGLSAISGPADLANLVSGSYSSTYGYSPPTWLFWLGIASWFPSTALFVVMLIALIKRGPWGMTKVSPKGSPAA